MDSQSSHLVSFSGILGFLLVCLILSDKESHYIENKECESYADLVTKVFTPISDKEKNKMLKKIEPECKLNVTKITKIKEIKNET